MFLFIYIVTSLCFFCIQFCTYICNDIKMFILQNPTDIISMNEALLVRFRSDDTIVNKGFSAAYVAVEPRGSEEIADRLSEEEERLIG